MEIITIISASGRHQSNTLKIARAYEELLSSDSFEIRFLSLSDVDFCKKDNHFLAMQETYLAAAHRFIIVMPEYNGSYPGILKLMIDQSDVSKCWHHKKVLLTGVATGRAGNLRGMEHLTGCLMHMKMYVHPNRLPISAVDTLLDESGKLTDIKTLEAIRTQLHSFLLF